MPSIRSGRLDRTATASPFVWAWSLHLGRPFGISTTDMALDGEAAPHVRDRERLRRNERRCPRQVDVTDDVDTPRGTPPRPGIVEAPPDDDALGTEVEVPDVAGVCVQCDVDLAIVD